MVRSGRGCLSPVPCPLLPGQPAMRATGRSGGAGRTFAEAPASSWKVSTRRVTMPWGGDSGPLGGLGADAPTGQTRSARAARTEEPLEFGPRIACAVRRRRRTPKRGVGNPTGQSRDREEAKESRTEEAPTAGAGSPTGRRRRSPGAVAGRKALDPRPRRHRREHEAALPRPLLRSIGIVKLPPVSRIPASVRG